MLGGLWWAPSMGYLKAALNSDVESIVNFNFWIVIYPTREVWLRVEWEEALYNQRVVEK